MRSTATLLMVYEIRTTIPKEIMVGLQNCSLLWLSCFKIKFFTSVLGEDFGKPDDSSSDRLSLYPAISVREKETFHQLRTKKGRQLQCYNLEYTSTVLNQKGITNNRSTYEGRYESKASYFFLRNYTYNYNEIYIHLGTPLRS